MRELIRAYGPLALVLGGLYLLFQVILEYVFPFMLAVVLAILLDPLVNRLERRARLPRSLAVGIVLVLIAVILVLFLVVGVARIAAELQVLAAAFPAYYRQLESEAARLWDLYGQWLEQLPPTLQEQLQERQDELVRSASTQLGSLADTLQNLVLAGLPNLLLVILFTLIATFFISRDREAVRDFVLYLAPAPWRDPLSRLLRRLAESLVGFVNAMIALILLTTAATTVGLALLGAPFAVLLGFTSGLLDLLPIIGPALLFVPWGTYHILLGDVWFGLRLLLLYGVISVVRTVAQAQIIGDRVGLHPLTTLASLYIGVRLFGGAGVIIGPVTAVIIQAMRDVGMLTIDGGPRGDGR
ncbi:MAG TPA: sporulation integral membrane protein YtvI [Bacillota bacterium]